MSLCKESDEQSSVDLGMNFELCLWNENKPSQEISLVDPKKLDHGIECSLQLSLSTGPSQERSLVDPKKMDHGPECSLQLSLSNVAPESVLPNLSLSAGQQEILEMAPTVNTKYSDPSNCLFGSSLKLSTSGTVYSLSYSTGTDVTAVSSDLASRGGGRTCRFFGCTRSPGRSDFCIGHGGGRRCCQEDCSRAARGQSGYCIRHGGLKRCTMENCRRSAEGYTGLCILHGGGRRCHFRGCAEGAQGSTFFCRKHGWGSGARLRYAQGEQKAAPYFARDGGDKRCASHGCTKSARGETCFCYRHGGGKRCKSDGCERITQGSSDFCKAHGGGERCSWGQPGSNFGDGGQWCNKFARKTGLCGAHGALVQDRLFRSDATARHFSSQLAPAEKLKPAAAECTQSTTSGGGEAGVAGILPEGGVHGGSVVDSVQQYRIEGEQTDAAATAVLRQA